MLGIRVPSPLGLLEKDGSTGNYPYMYVHNTRLECLSLCIYIYIYVCMYTYKGVPECLIGSSISTKLSQRKEL